MKIESQADLAKRVDKFPMTWVLKSNSGEIQMIDKQLIRESPRNSELAHYLDVLRRLHAGMLLAKTEVERSEWLKELKDDIFLYFCEENKWLNRDMLDPISEKKTVEILEKITSVVADLAEKNADEKKKLEPWETYESGLRKYLEATGKSLVDFLDERYYRYIQEIQIRTAPYTEEMYTEKVKQSKKVMDIKDYLPI